MTSLAAWPAIFKDHGRSHSQVVGVWREELHRFDACQVVMLQYVIS